MNSVTSHRVMVATVAALCWVAGCGYPVSVEVDNTSQMASLSTYGWEPDGGEVKHDMVVDPVEIDRWVREAVDAGMLAKGYQLKKRGKPDFRVGYQCLVEKKVRKSDPGPDTLAIQQQIYIGVSSAPKPPARKYNLGTLILHMTEPGATDSFWCASAQSMVHAGVDAEKRRERISKAVESLLKKFPDKDAGSW